MSHFATLRDYLTEAASLETLGKLMLLFQNWDKNDPERSMALEYTESHMQEWPEVLKQLYRWDEDESAHAWEQLWGLLDKANDGTGASLVKAFQYKLRNWDPEICSRDSLNPYSPGWGLLKKVTSSTLSMEDDEEEFDAFRVIAKPLLHTLNFKASNIENDSIRNMLSAVDLTQLHRLDLESNLLNDEGLNLFLDALGEDHLVELCLGWNEISVKGLERLVNEPKLKNLTRLQFENNEIVGTQVQLLANPPYLRKLTFLELYNNDMGNSGLLSLLEEFNHPHLEHLFLDNNQFDDEVMPVIASCEAFANLKELALDRNDIQDEGAQLLLQSETLKNIETIRVSLSDAFSESTTTELENNPRFSAY